MAGTGNLLANTSNVQQSLTSGFTAADILQVFEVKKGFVLTPLVGAYVTTTEGDTCTADIGNSSATQTHRLASNPDGYMGTFNLNSAVAQITLIADEDLGGSTYQGVVFITDGTIDITFGHNTDAAVFDVFACGFQCFYG